LLLQLRDLYLLYAVITCVFWFFIVLAAVSPGLRAPLPLLPAGCAALARLPRYRHGPVLLVFPLLPHVIAVTLRLSS